MTAPSDPGTSPDPATEPWQLGMFRKGLKKRQRLKCLRKLLGQIMPSERCLLLTCGDNNGAMNYFLRELGGTWSWADLEDVCLDEMSELLGEPVIQAQEDKLPFAEATFDRIVSIDVHEHVDDPRIVNGELCRILKPGGQLIVTTPNGDETRLAVRLKNAVGMSKEAYGHRRIGLTSGEIESLMRADHVTPVRTLTFSRLITELLELTINFAYVKILSRKDRPDQDHDHVEIAPATSGQLQTVSKSYRIYSLIFPVYWLLSKLDGLLFFTEGYCVMVDGRRPA
jgi:SAM-dependent methyltransferase